MKQIISDFYGFISYAINNEHYINILSIVVVAFTSYQVAKYNSSKPEKIRIKQMQLSKVYLPLFRLFSDLPSTLSKEQALTLCKKMINILDCNYELVFPQLHRLVARLKKEIISNTDYSKTISIIRHQICIDYELLKKSLGYPSESLLNIFARMTFSQKLNVLSVYFQIIILFAPIIPIYIAVLYSQNKPALPLITASVLVLLLFVFLMLRRIIKHLDD